MTYKQSKEHILQMWIVTFSDEVNVAIILSIISAEKQFIDHSSFFY